ncbi:MAG: AmmeMemoRadiSam system protein B [Candidatus Omnitrophota bacterium]
MKIQNSKFKIKNCGIKLKILVFFLILTLNYCLFSFAQDVQEAVVADAFYPADPKELKAMVDGFIDKAEVPQIEGEIIAVVLPHAGYQYSGHVAGYGAKIIKDKDFDTVILVALSHRVPFNGLTVLDKDFYKTPLGNVAVDKEITQKLLAYSTEISSYKAPFTIEHSAEVEIPFMQRLLPNARIAIILTGDFSYKNCSLLRDSLVSVVNSSNKKVLLLASTDMSHFFTEKEAHDIDALTLKDIEGFNPESLYKKCEAMSNSERPCGTIGLVGVMMAARQLGANEIKVLKYATSADTTPDKSRVVGYFSAVIYKSPSHQVTSSPVKENEEKAMGNLLNQKQKTRLLEIARGTIENYINKKGAVLEIKEDDPVLNKELGAFVTLHKNGQLRGCIGNMIGRGALCITVRDMAIAAATQDPRFRKVTADELQDIDIEISVLSQMQKIEDPSKIIMGTHGVLVKQGFRSGVFLPQVATETGWDKETFMNNLCAQKAGLEPDAWKKGECEIFIYTAEVFGEKK